MRNSVKLWVDIGKASERIFTQEAESSDVESAVFIYSLTQEKSESSVKEVIALLLVQHRSSQRMQTEQQASMY